MMQTIQYISGYTVLYKFKILEYITTENIQYLKYIKTYSNL